MSDIRQRTPMLNGQPPSYRRPTPVQAKMAYDPYAIYDDAPANMDDFVSGDDAEYLPVSGGPRQSAERFLNSSLQAELTIAEALRRLADFGPGMTDKDRQRAADLRGFPEQGPLARYRSAAAPKTNALMAYQVRK